MFLTDQQKRMRDGALGEPVQVAMEMLCALGEIYGAEKLIPVKSAHCAGLSFKSHGIAGMKWAEDMAAKGARVVVPTTMNVIGVDRTRNLGLPADWTEYQLRIEKAYENMGCFGTSSCVPYYYSFLPRFGEHIAWAESSAVVFTNSVLGARDNREGGPSAWAAGITGFTPYYGLHLDENRAGQILFKVTTPLHGIADYGALGSYVGKLTGEKIPVFEGLGHPTTEELVYFGAALASSGGVALFHAIGITPEAPDLPRQAPRCGGVWSQRAGAGVRQPDIRKKPGCRFCSHGLSPLQPESGSSAGQNAGREARQRGRHHVDTHQHGSQGHGGRAGLSEDDRGCRCGTDPGPVCGAEQSGGAGLQNSGDPLTQDGFLCPWRQWPVHLVWNRGAMCAGSPYRPVGAGLGQPALIPAAPLTDQAKKA